MGQMGHRRVLMPIFLASVLGCGRWNFDQLPSDPPGDAVSDLGAASWAEIGASASALGVSQVGTAGVSTTRLGVRAGRATVAWADPLYGDGDVYLRHWDGSSWTGLGQSATQGGPFSMAGECLAGSLVFDERDRPGLLIRHNPDGVPRPMHYYQWNGADWITLGDPDLGLTRSDFPNPWWPSAVHDGELVVAFESYNLPVGGTGIFVLRWDGQEWVGLDSSDSGHGITDGIGSAQGAAIARAPSGEITVAWSEERDGVRDIYLKEWDGQTWTALGESADSGGISASPLGSTRPSIEYLGDGRLLAVWTDESTGDYHTLRSRVWDGVEWTDGGLEVPSAKHPALEVDANGVAYAGWAANDGDADNIHIARLGGSGWGELASPSSSANPSRWPKLATDPDDPNGVYVAWQEVLSDTHNEAYVRRLIAPGQ